ncbi:MAG: glutaredoxin family protein [Promethearchaeota archaeon]
MSIELFATAECPKCEKLKKMLGTLGAEFVVRNISEDPEAETDALMLNIFAAPALKKSEGGELLRVKDIFPGGKLDEKKVKEFFGIQ